jgi:hypothetical protein
MAPRELFGVPIPLKDTGLLCVHFRAMGQTILVQCRSGTPARGYRRPIRPENGEEALAAVAKQLIVFEQIRKPVLCSRSCRHRKREFSTHPAPK